MLFSCYSVLQETTEKISKNRIFKTLRLRKVFCICEKLWVLILKFESIFKISKESKY